MTAKIAISLPDEVLELARAAVRDGAAPTLSAFIAEAIRRVAEADDLEQVLDAMAVERGHPSAADRAWAREALGR